MENKVIVMTEDQLSKLLQPIMTKLQNMEDYLFNDESKSNKVYSDKEASLFLKVSQKKLQNLRNSREIAFIRENGGRKILYTQAHLMDYLKNNELKKIK